MSRAPPPSHRSSHRGALSFLNSSCSPVSGPAASTPIDDDNLINVFQLSSPLGRLADGQVRMRGEQQGLRAVTSQFLPVWEELEDQHSGQFWPTAASFGTEPNKATKYWLN